MHPRRISGLLRLACVAFSALPGLLSGLRAAPFGDAVIGRAYRERLSSVQVEGEGSVTRLLEDDTNGTRHQRFILRLRSGQTLLIAHNIEIAPRIQALRVNDQVRFYGEYEWNSRGGAIHWTHRDPMRKHKDGWLKHQGKTYQ